MDCYDFSLFSERVCLSSFKSFSADVKIRYIIHTWSCLHKQHNYKNVVMFVSFFQRFVYETKAVLQISYTNIGKLKIK